MKGGKGKPVQNQTEAIVENQTISKNGVETTQMRAFVNTQQVIDGASITPPVSGVGKQWAATVEQTAQFPPSWCQTYVSPQNSAGGSPAQGAMTPMADVASSSRAPYPTQVLSAQFGLQSQRDQNWGGRPKSFPVSPYQGSRSGSGPESGPNTPSKQRKRNRADASEQNRAVHGSRALAAAGGDILRNMLYEPDPRRPDDPEEGISNEVIEAEKRGGEAVKLSIEVPDTRSQEYWRSQVRSKRAHGSPIEEFYMDGI